MTLICLQGGAEFGIACLAMDSGLVAEAALRREGPVVIAPLASAPGYEHDRAGANGANHFAKTGATRVVVAPDARAHADAAIDVWRQASLLVLPGGSPSRLLSTLRDTGLDDVLAELVADGVVVMGASAGAMVLCEHTWLPDQGQVVDGLGLVPDHLVLPHWDGRRRLPADTAAAVRGLGIPERSGVIVIDGVPLWSTGRSGSALLGHDGARRALPRPPAESPFAGA
jgi:cyanophycinase-like exopeptidase